VPKNYHQTRIAAHQLVEVLQDTVSLAATPTEHQTVDHVIHYSAHAHSPAPPTKVKPDHEAVTIVTPRCIVGNDQHH